MLPPPPPTLATFRLSLYISLALALFLYFTFHIEVVYNSTLLQNLFAFEREMQILKAKIKSYSIVIRFLLNGSNRSPAKCYNYNRKIDFATRQLRKLNGIRRVEVQFVAAHLTRSQQNQFTLTVPWIPCSRLGNALYSIWHTVT